MTALFRPASVQSKAGTAVASIPAAALADHYARIVAAHGEELKQHRRRERGGTIFTFVHAGVTAALAAALVAMMPLKSFVPVFVHLHDDGSFTSTISQSDLPRSLTEATTKAALWLYVRAREGYAAASWNEDQRIVYMLSDKGAGDVYESLVNARNPESPARKFGTRTVIRLDRVSEQFLCAHDSCFGRDADAYQVRFRRVVLTQGQAPVDKPWVATVRFHRVDAIPAWQRVTYNPLGLQVVEYRAEEEGAQ
jgi:type IV secretion system protein VirB8